MIEEYFNTLSEPDEGQQSARSFSPELEELEILIKTDIMVLTLNRIPLDKGKQPEVGETPIVKNAED